MTRKEIIENPLYHLELFQGDVYRQVSEHMRQFELSNEQMADKIGVSIKVLKSILNGDCKLSIATLTSMCVKMGFVPVISYVSLDNYEDHIKKMER